MERVPKHLHSRLLYTNPVCLLTVVDGNDEDNRNVMTCSWLTPTSNKGEFFLSLHAGRHSLAMLRETKRFCLSVPVKGMEELVVKIGSCSGKNVDDKLNHLEIETCSVGKEEHDDDEGEGTIRTGSTEILGPASGKARRKANERLEAMQPKVKVSKKERKRKRDNDAKQEQESLIESSVIAVKGCAAHIVATVSRFMDDVVDKHAALFCQIELAYVKKDYWTSKTFAPTDPSTPPYLTFLGSREFSYVSGRHTVELGEEEAAQPTEEVKGEGQRKKAKASPAVDKPSTPVATEDSQNPFALLSEE